MRNQNRITRSIAASLALPMIVSGCLMNDPVETAISPAPDLPPNGNRAPAIFGSPPRMVKVGVSYSFVPAAYDPDADSLTFNIKNKPNWAQFDLGTGQLSGTPSLGSEGTYSRIAISVSDSSMSTALPEFSVAVEPATTPNIPPDISGAPVTNVTVGNNYSFTPAASDPDGDLLTFTAMNVPSWATFNAATGSISGTPQVGDESIYANISITVSDGMESASLPAFGIQVDAVSLGSATLTWIPPTLNEDGSPLMDLNSYVVYYGTAPTALNNSIPLDNPGLTRYVVENLTPNTYYFAITAVNSLDVESRFSDTASKIVN